MMPYDATLLPVSREVILHVANANVHSLLGLAPVQRPLSEVAKDALLGPSSIATPAPAGTRNRLQLSPRAPLKIAYYGYDFNNHPMGHLTCGMF